MYVRFGTKARLLQRAVDVAIVGDTASADLRSRDAFQHAVTAATQHERIAAFAQGSRWVMARASGILAVAHQAAASEPEIEAAAHAGRKATRALVHEFWQRMTADGLMSAGGDVTWLAETTAVLAQADTHQLLVQSSGMSDDEYEEWLVMTWTRLLHGRL